MLIPLHKQATTTPRVTAAIQASDTPASHLAERFGTTEQTVYKGRHQDGAEDRRRTPNRPQTTLTPAQEAVPWRCAKRFWCRSMTSWWLCTGF